MIRSNTNSKINFQIFKFSNWLTILFCFTISLTVNAQEMWGISNSNYAGNMGIFLNPSTIVAAPYKYDFNFFTLNVFAENSFVYVPSKYKVIPTAIEGDYVRQNATTVENYQHPSQHVFLHAHV